MARLGAILEIQGAISCKGAVSSKRAGFPQGLEKSGKTKKNDKSQEKTGKNRVFLKKSENLKKVRFFLFKFTKFLEQ